MHMWFKDAKPLYGEGFLLAVIPLPDIGQMAWLEAVAL